MDWEPRALREAERLFNGGRPSGPRLDALWQRLQPAVVPARPPWWRSAWVLGWVPALAAASVLLLWTPAEFRERAAGAEGPTVEASCGTTTQPCRVGQSVYFRVGPHARGGMARLWVVFASGPSPLGGPVAVAAQDATPVAVKVVPEAADVEAGLRVLLYWRAPVAAETPWNDPLPGDAPPAHVLTLRVDP